MDFFGPPNHWGATVVLILLVGMIVFLIVCLAGVFVDPSMTQATRGVVVGVWGVASCLIAIGIMIGRHGN